MSFTVDLAVGYAEFLVAGPLGLTWQADGQYADGQRGVFIGPMPPGPPDGPDTVVVLAPYTLADDPALSDSTIGMQIRCRGPRNDYVSPVAIDDNIADYLLGQYPVTLPNGIYIAVLQRTSSTVLGQDPSQRWLTVSNYTNQLYRPTAHRH